MSRPRSVEVGKSPYGQRIMKSRAGNYYVELSDGRELHITPEQFEEYRKKWSEESK